MGSAFHQPYPRYSGTLTPTAPTTIRLWETFTFTLFLYETVFWSVLLMTTHWLSMKDENVTLLILHWSEIHRLFNKFWNQPAIVSVFKVFPSTKCPYCGVKVTCFGKIVKVLPREFSTTALKSLQNNAYNAIGKFNLMKISTIILIVNSCWNLRIFGRLCWKHLTTEIGKFSRTGLLYYSSNKTKQAFLQTPLLLYDFFPK